MKAMTFEEWFADNEDELQVCAIEAGIYQSETVYLEFIKREFAIYQHQIAFSNA